jgi:hypothetical protein
MTPSENHDRLALEFIMTVAYETRSHSELMIIVESVILSAMLVSHEVYRLPSAGCVEMIEMAIQQATARFSAMEAR